MSYPSNPFEELRASVNEPELIASAFQDLLNELADLVAEDPTDPTNCAIEVAVDMARQKALARKEIAEIESRADHLREVFEIN